MSVVILGAGITGLAAAYRLVKHNIKPIIIEKESRVGGLAGSYSINNYTVEKYYHHLFVTDRTFINLAKELNLDSKIKWYKSKISFYYKGKFYKFSSPLDLLFFKPLKFLDRIRFGLNILNLKKENNLDEINAEAWLTRKWSKGIYEILFKRMLKMKFGVSMDEVSASFVHGRLKARADSRKKGRELLGYFEGGFNSFIEGLKNELEELGCKILTNSEVKTIRKGENDFIIKTQNREIKSKIILNTIPIPDFKEITKFDINIEDVDYQAVICLTLGLRKKLSNFYWNNILVNEIAFGILVEHTNLISNKNYNNEHIIYLANYYNRNEEILKKGEQTIFNIYIGSLKRIFPNLRREDILWQKVSKDLTATPIFKVGYKNQEITTNVPGLYLAGSFQVYPTSRNMNNSIEKGFQAADIIIKEVCASHAKED